MQFDILSNNSVPPNFDPRDLQLLELVAQNCRLSHQSLAAALKVSKDTISYRLARLEAAKVLSQCMLFIDARPLGFTRYHILMRLDSELRDQNKTIKMLCKHPFVMWVNSFTGSFDIQIIVDAVDAFQLNQIREELFKICEDRIQDYSVLTHLYDLEFTQITPLLNFRTKFDRSDDFSFSNLLSPRRFPVKPKFQRFEVTSRDMQLLRVLADDPRISLSALAEKVSCDRQTARKNVIRLIKGGIILSFGGVPNPLALGYVTYYLLVRVAQNTPPTMLERPFRKLQNIFYAGRMLGDYDLILYLNARNPTELNQSVAAFRAELGSHIRHYELLIQNQVHHWRQFTDGIFQTMMRKDG